MLASLLRIILLTATLKILERVLDKGPIIYIHTSMIQQKKDGSGKLNRFLIIFEPNPKYLRNR